VEVEEETLEVQQVLQEVVGEMPVLLAVLVVAAVRLLRVVLL
jgi:hypothetical protein